ncbi:DUF2937 family protein [Photobacterium galatheae]|uniref:DUF2937 domain-containing protein n=1 Tax=Photobacterium galatheae TaxID=1654360 RepID=A0A066RL20_9GAMM|nr:DUF2937 family protein [Photobacterium galatheae]KDM89801.1 hypothetical protein EA58_20325 [Photobacterium galatheae]MCM0151451.1 DUF2937 family protein [Photobacterium galatheae]
MIGKLLDKLIFGAALLLALQLPLLADHYQQYLAGMYESTQWQVNGYQATAHRFGYTSVQAMIERHLTNEEPSVRADANQKKATLARYQSLQNGMTVFRQGNLFSKVMYMFHPTRLHDLEKTLTNFKPGIPFTLSGIAFGVITALLANLIITLPFSFLTKRRQHQMATQSSAQRVTPAR